MRNFLKFVDLTSFAAAIILLIGTAYTQWDPEGCNTVSLLSIGMIVVVIYAKLFTWIMTGRLTFKK
jgi:hypothetical protein